MVIIGIKDHAAMTGKNYLELMVHQNSNTKTLTKIWHGYLVDLM